MKLSSQLKQGLIKPAKLLTLPILLLSAQATANDSISHSDIVFNLMPNQCIALSQGKKCYVDIEITWQSKTNSNLCLYSSQSTAAIRCWKQANNGSYQNEVVSTKNVQFVLKDDKNNTLATSELKMAWVYKKNTRARSNWRMF